MIFTSTQKFAAFRSVDVFWACYFVVLDRYVFKICSSGMSPGKVFPAKSLGGHQSMFIRMNLMYICIVGPPPCLEVDL